MGRCFSKDMFLKHWGKEGRSNEVDSTMCCIDKACQASVDVMLQNVAGRHIIIKRLPTLASLPCLIFRESQASSRLCRGRLFCGNGAKFVKASLRMIDALFSKFCMQWPADLEVVSLCRLRAGSFRSSATVAWREPQDGIATDASPKALLLASLARCSSEVCLSTS